MPLEFDIESGRIIKEVDDTPPPRKNIRIIEILEPNTILSGKGKPDVSLGNNGDFYLETESWEIYGPKTDVWGSGTSIKGMDGAPGLDGLPGKDGETIVGRDGISILDVSLSGDMLTIETSDGKAARFKIDLPKDGAPGVGIVSIEQSNDTIIFRLSDGRAVSCAFPKGDNAREIELQATGTHVQWRRVGDLVWTDLYAIPKGRMGFGGGGRPKLVDMTAMLVAGIGITITSDLMANTLTIASSAGAGPFIKTDGTSTTTARIDFAEGIGPVGDIPLGDSTLRVMYPETHGKIDLGKAINAFRKLFLSDKIDRYGDIATVGNGVPAEYGKIDTTALSANVGATLLYAVPSSGAGMYRVSALAVLTTAASVSSTLPTIQIVYTDNQTGGAITIDATPSLAAAGLGQTGALAANTVGLTATGVIAINAAASTNINYQTVNYASNAAGMLYAIHITLEAL